MVNDGLVDSDSDNVTIGAVSGADDVVTTLMNAITIIKGLEDDAFKKKAHKRKKSLINKINAVLSDIDEDDEFELEDFEDAHDKLVSDILPKLDGCANSVSPDRKDWIITCAAQGQVYPVLQLAVALLEQAILTNPDPEDDEDDED